MQRFPTQTTLGQRMNPRDRTRGAPHLSHVAPFNIDVTAWRKRNWNFASWPKVRGAPPVPSQSTVARPVPPYSPPGRGSAGAVPPFPLEGVEASTAQYTRLAGAVY